MQWIWQDLRYALRGLRKQPSFAFLAILALALGIGASTTIFSAIYGVLLNPFPYTNAERIVDFYIHDTSSSRPGGRTFFKAAEFIEYDKERSLFEDVIGGGNEDVLYTTKDGTELFTGAYVTPNTFAFLGVPAQLGRTLTPEDAKPGAAPVFVLAYAAWLKTFNLDPTILNRDFMLNGVKTKLVGIMPVRFTKRGADLWRPVRLDRADQRYFMFQARVKPGVTLEQVQSQFTVVAHRVAGLYPEDYPKNFTVGAENYVDNVVGHFKATLYTLAAAVGLLLLIACANVANLLLARATAREKEIGMRTALGASRGRLISQLLVESLILAVGGAIAGCVLSYGGIKMLVSAIPDGAIPRESVITLNGPVLAFSMAVAVLTAVIFGLAPALQLSRRDVVEALRDSGKGSSGGFRRGKLRNALVIVEVALSMVLLCGAGLLMRTFIKLQTVDLGFNPENILVARLPLPKGVYDDAAGKQRFFRPLLARLSALPGVVAATETSTLPPYGGIRSDVEIPGKTHSEKWQTIFQLTSEGYAPTLGVRLLRGRLLNEGDINGVRKYAVVNQTFVQKFIGAEDPLGKQMKLSFLETMKPHPMPNAVFEIVGVVSDSKNQGLQDPILPEAFIPYTVTGQFERGILVRTAGDPNAMLNTVRREIWAVDRNVALTLTGTLTGYLKQFSYAEPRFSLMLLSVFAGVGLVLVALGVYSVIAYTVSRQTHEIGIRMALGAERGHVLQMVLKMGLRLSAIGIVVGLIATSAVTRVIASQLWQVSPHDPVTLGGVVMLVTGVGLAACYFPAKRATRVDPMIALRYE
ncbi:MAG TPA: ABC transporter permease [Bryobacteraceae bacterium]